MTRREEREHAAYDFVSIEYSSPYANFIQGAEWADKTMLDKVCEWIESVNLDYYQIREGVFSKELVIDFRKAMEE